SPARWRSMRMAKRSVPPCSTSTSTSILRCIPADARPAGPDLALPRRLHANPRAHVHPHAPITDKPAGRIKHRLARHLQGLGPSVGQAAAVDEVEEGAAV